ncbi:MAG: HD domain-containing protein [Bacteroidota bacterium]
MELTPLIQQDLDSIISFMKVAEGLKNTLRSSHTSNGREESVAEHTWRLCLLAMMLQKYYPNINYNRLLKILLIHDMGEIINGDIPAIYQDPAVDKSQEERKDFLEVISPLTAEQQAEMLELWDEYNEVSSPEAKLAKALDKIETVLQHLDGKNPDDFDYVFNLGYGTKYTSLDPVISYLRGYVDDETRNRIKG